MLATLSVSLGLIIVGLVMVVLAPKVTQPLLSRIVWWAGAVLLVIGLLLLATPVLNWIDHQLRSMLGVQQGAQQ
jgi:hypothetical protein